MVNKEKRNRAISIYVSIGAHIVLLLVFFLMLAWTEPDPPIPEYGIELNLGSTAIPGSEVESPLSQDEVEESDAVSEEAEVEPDDVQQTEQTAKQEVEGQDTEALESDPDEEVLDDVDSPDVVEETTPNEDTQQEEVEETDEGVDSESSASTEALEEDKDVKNQTEEPKIDDRAIFKKNNESSSDSNAEGSSLDLAGWNWDFEPQPDDKSTETGMVVFQITIDDEGEIIGIKTLEKTISPVVEKVYRDAVMELTFSKTSDNRLSAATSTGKITFIIQSK